MEQRIDRVQPRVKMPWDELEHSENWPSYNKAEPGDKIVGRRSPANWEGKVVVIQQPTGKWEYLTHVVQHSDGFEWGYGGSGPADLALSILTAVAGFQIASVFYQEYKHEVVAALPKHGWEIDVSSVIGWIRRESLAEYEAVKAGKYNTQQEGN